MGLMDGEQKTSAYPASAVWPRLPLLAITDHRLSRLNALAGRMISSFARASENAPHSKLTVQSFYHPTHLHYFCIFSFHLLFLCIENTAQ